MYLPFSAAQLPLLTSPHTVFSNRPNLSLFFPLFLSSRGCVPVSFVPTNMTLPSFDAVGTTDINCVTDTNCVTNSNSRLSSTSRSPSYDTLSERIRLFPYIQSHDLLSPDVRLTSPQQAHSARTSANSSPMNTPNPSRSTSPFPQFYFSSQSCASDTDSDEPASPLLLDTYRSYLRDGPPRWWQLRQRPRRGLRRPAGWGFRTVIRVLRRVFRHPFFPKHPATIVCLSSFRVPVRSTKSAVPSSFLFCFSQHWRYP